MEKHEQNLRLYLENGGDPKIAARYKIPNLDNRAKISYLLSKLQIRSKVGVISCISNKVVENNNEEREVLLAEENLKKPKFLGFISQYPVELHSTYNTAYMLWIELCSLKIQLNAILEKDEEKAYEVQSKMLVNFKEFDQCKMALDHYSEFKRILPIKAGKDYTSLSPNELVKEKSNLAGLISRRRVTIKNMEDSLPSPHDDNYKKLLDAVNLKKEKLQEFILNEEKIKELLGYNN